MMEMDLLIGGCYGSEWKAGAAQMLSDRFRYDGLICVNSAQAGHTAHWEENGKWNTYVSRQLPSSCISNRDVMIFLAVGSVINLDVLLKEIREMEELGIPIAHRLWINRFATVIEHPDEEKSQDVDWRQYGSTQEGVGPSIARRALHKGAIIKDYEDRIRDAFPDVTFFDDITAHLWDGTFFLEGSQGFQLSTFWKHYPKVTSRNCTAAGFIAMAGLPPITPRHVYGVFRTFPIRVAGNSGPMGEEIDWETVSKESGYDDLTEITTVTKRIRRVARFNVADAIDAVRVNAIDRPLLTFVNYLNKEDEGKVFWKDLSHESRSAISKWEMEMGAPFWGYSTSKYGGWIIGS